MKIMLSIIISVSAIIQLCGIGGKFNHGLYNYQKFIEHNGGGYTTLSYELTIFTYIASIILIILCFVLNKYKENNLWYKLTSKIGLISLVFGLIILTVLLISPLGKIK